MLSTRATPIQTHTTRAIATTASRRAADPALASQADDTPAIEDVPETISASQSNSTESPPIPSKIKLRPYQELAVSECLSAIAAGITRIGVSAPTGSGKTTMFTELISRLPAAKHNSSDSWLPSSSSNYGNRVLIVVNSIELAIQAANAVTRAYPHLLVEIEQGAKFKATGFADVTVATYQTLVRSAEGGQDRLNKFQPGGLKAVIVDEAHHAASKSYIYMLNKFDDHVGLTREQREQQDEQHAASGPSQPKQTHNDTAIRVPIIGFSATFSRHDGLALGRIFDRIVYHRDFLEMIDEEWLCPVRFTTIQADLDLNAVRVSQSTGDFNTRSLSVATNTSPTNKLIVRSWLEKAKSRRSTLIFATDVQHTIDLTEEFRQAGIDARYLHGRTTIKERKQILAAFKAGLYPVLINCAILTEGFDLPQIDCVLLARPTRSQNLFSQMIGRGLRLSPESGKTDCLILDVVGTLQRGVVCTPTLFGIDASHDIEDASVDDLKDRLRERQENDSDQDAPSLHSSDHDDPNKVTFIDYDSPHELQMALLSRNSGGTINTLSPNAWVHCGGSHYVLRIPKHGYIRVAPDEDQPPDSDSSSEPVWTAAWTREVKDRDEGASPWLRPIEILSSRHQPELSSDSNHYQSPRPNLAAVIQLCDNYATTCILHSGPNNILIRRDAPWRQKPATPSQRRLVEQRISGRKQREEETTEEAEKRARQLEDLTMGKVSDILVRLNHGFRSRWQRQVKAHNKAEKVKAKELQRREKETVRVGDL